MTDMTNTMSTKEAAKKLGVHIETVRRAIREGKIEIVCIGRGHRISHAALDAYVKSQTIGVK